MEKQYFDSLMEGLEQAISYVRGDKSQCRETVVEIPDTENGGEISIFTGRSVSYGKTESDLQS